MRGFGPGLLSLSPGSCSSRLPTARCPVINSMTAADSQARAIVTKYHPLPVHLPICADALRHRYCFTYWNTCPAHRVPYLTWLHPQPSCASPPHNTIRTYLLSHENNYEKNKKGRGSAQHPPAGQRHRDSARGQQAARPTAHRHHLVLSADPAAPPEPAPCIREGLSWNSL
jgi:hypothetical protein